MVDGQVEWTGWSYGRLVGGLAGGLAVIGVTIVALEGAASLGVFALDLRASATPPTFRGHTSPDTLLGWVNRPSFSSPDEFGRGIGLTTTPEGYRTTSAPGASVRIRAVCSGDSFTLGFGVADDKNWCSRLADLVPGLVTANMGQSGYGLDQAILWYLRDGGRLPHQVQVLGVNLDMLEHSLTGNHMGRLKPVFELQDGALLLRNVPVPAQTRGALRRAYAWRAIEGLRTTQVIRRVLGLDDQQVVARQLSQRWPVFEAILARLAAHDREKGVALLMVYLPNKRHDLQPGAPSDEWRRRLGGLAERLGFQFLDVTPAFRALRPDSLDLATIAYAAPDAAPGITGHYSDLGNAWAAALIARKLQGMLSSAGGETGQ